MREGVLLRARKLNNFRKPHQIMNTRILLVVGLLGLLCGSSLAMNMKFKGKALAEEVRLN